jgi:hypothetical protein
MQKCKIGVHGVSLLVAGRNIFCGAASADRPNTHSLDERSIWSNGGMIIDR